LSLNQVVDGGPQVKFFFCWNLNVNLFVILFVLFLDIKLNFSGCLLDDVSLLLLLFSLRMINSGKFLACGVFLGLIIVPLFG